MVRIEEPTVDRGAPGTRSPRLEECARGDSGVPTGWRNISRRRVSTWKWSILVRLYLNSPLRPLLLPAPNTPGGDRTHERTLRWPTCCGPAGAPRRLRDHFSDAPDEAKALLGRRFAIVNVWRSINGRVRNAPLALCDAASVAPEDLVSVERRARDRIGEIQQAAYSPTHRWYYFPEMAMDEALLIKTYDSATDGRARFTIHTSFEDPGAPPDAPPRESLETRCFAFF